MKTDFAIIGAGPAGCAAAMQARRDGTEFTLIDFAPVGGLVAAARRIDNLPGYPGGVLGVDYGNALAAQASALSINKISDRVESIKRDGDRYRLNLAGGGEVRASAILLACGTEPIEWNIPGAEEAQNHGRLFRDMRPAPVDLNEKQVLVLGGGEAAADGALNAEDRGGRTTLLMRGSELKAGPHLIEEIAASSIEVVKSARAVRIAKNERAFSLVIENGAYQQEWPFDYLLVCIGRRPRFDLWRELQIGEPPKTVKTAAPGVFAAGDMIRGIDRYIACALGDGASAAILARRYLEGGKL